MERVTRKKIKVLMILPTLNICGGIESYVISYYRKLRKEVKFDFITHICDDNYYKDEIEKNGDKVFLFKKMSLKNIINNYKEAKEFYKKYHDYDIVHCNMANGAFIHLYYAKKYGIKVRILHSHQNKLSDKFLHSIRNFPLVLLGKKYATNKIACTSFAGDYLFGKNNYDTINNAIDTTSFIYNEEFRKEIRIKYSIKDNDFVVGNIGRFAPVKNQIFLIKIFNEILKLNRNSKLMIIGDGELKSEIEQTINDLNLNGNVFIIKSTPNVNKYMSAFDVFVLPSLYEGLGIVNIEAQANGLKVIASSNVPQDIVMKDGMVDFISLSKNEKCWAKEILKNINKKRVDVISYIKKNGYDITYNSSKLLELYKKYLGDIYE